MRFCLSICGLALLMVSCKARTNQSAQELKGFTEIEGKTTTNQAGSVTEGRLFGRQSWKLRFGAEAKELVFWDGGLATTYDQAVENCSQFPRGYRQLINREDFFAIATFADVVALPRNVIFFPEQSATVSTDPQAPSAVRWSYFRTQWSFVKDVLPQRNDERDLMVGVMDGHGSGLVQISLRKLVSDYQPAPSVAFHRSELGNVPDSPMKTRFVTQVESLKGGITVLCTGQHLDGTSVLEPKSSGELSY
jgi:hypothetical protein